MTREAVRVIWWPFLLGLVGVVAVLSTDQLELHAFLNKFHPVWGDPFFMWFTHVADGLTALAITLYLAVRVSFRSALYVGASAGLSGIVVQFLKHVPFSDLKRPAHFLEQMSGLRIPDGVELATQFSFPSGHAACAFASFIALAMLYRNAWWSGLFVLAAVLAAYSRVWISMHFMEDVLVGSAIGTIMAMMFYRLLYSDGMLARKALDGNLIGVLFPKTKEQA